MLNLLTIYERPIGELSYDHLDVPSLFEPINPMTTFLNSLCSLHSALNADFNAEREQSIMFIRQMTWSLQNFVLDCYEQVKI